MPSRASTMRQPKCRLLATLGFWLKITFTSSSRALSSDSRARASAVLLPPAARLGIAEIEGAVGGEAGVQHQVEQAALPARGDLQARPPAARPACRRHRSPACARAARSRENGPAAGRPRPRDAPGPGRPSPRARAWACASRGIKEKPQANWPLLCCARNVSSGFAGSCACSESQRQSYVCILSQTVTC